MFANTKNVIKISIRDGGTYYVRSKDDLAVFITIANALHSILNKSSKVCLIRAFRDATRLLLGEKIGLRDAKRIIEEGLASDFDFS